MESSYSEIPPTVTTAASIKHHHLGRLSPTAAEAISFARWICPSPPVARVPETNSRGSVKGSAAQLVDKRISYPPGPSSAPLSPSQMFSPGQIHMHKEGQRDGGDGWMGEIQTDIERKVEGGSIQSHLG